MSLTSNLAGLRPDARDEIVRRLRAMAAEACERAAGDVAAPSTIREAHVAMGEAADTIADLVEAMAGAPSDGSRWRMPGCPGVVHVHGIRVSDAGVDVFGLVCTAHARDVAEFALPLTEWATKGMVEVRP